MKIPQKIRKALKKQKLDPNTKKQLLKSSFSEEMMRTQWLDAEKNKVQAAEPDYEKVWQRISETVESENQTRTLRLKTVLRYAAVLAIGIISYLAGLYIGGLEKTDQVLQVAQTPPGAISEIRLPDNSRLWLNAQSSVEYDNDFGINHRNLNITGEAYFDVAENKDLPFTVNVKENKVVALGTEFYVSAYEYNEMISSGLISGKIRIETEKETIVLNNPGAASFNLNKGSLISKGNLEPSHYEWKNGKLIFNNTSLQELSYRLSNWYNHDIKVEESIKDQKFTLRIEDENINEVLELIKLASDLEYKTTDTGYYIYSN